MAVPIDLSKTPVHIPSTTADAKSYTALNNFHFDGPSFGKYIEEHCSDDNPGRLVMVETSPTDWPSWERHTEGDELVIVTAGKGTFYQQQDDEVISTPFSAGDALLNPQGVWHTADVTEPMTAVYITPCPGTEHKPRS